jgi:hypothetical protein
MYYLCVLTLPYAEGFATSLSIANVSTNSSQYQIYAILSYPSSWL